MNVLLISTILLVISIILNFYFYFSNRQKEKEVKITGGIFGMTKGVVNNPGWGLDDTFFLSYINLTSNEHDPRTIKDFQLTVTYGGLTYPLKRLYSSEFLVKQLFEDTTKAFYVPNILDKLLNKKDLTFYREKPLKGFLVFLGKKEFNDLIADSYRLTLVFTDNDSTDLICYPKDFMIHSRLAEETGMVLKGDMRYQDATNNRLVTLYYDSTHRLATKDEKPIGSKPDSTQNPDSTKR